MEAIVVREAIPAEEAAVLHTVKSKKSIREIETLFPQVASRNKFGVLGVHNLKAKMNERGVPFERDCLVFEVCNPPQAKKVLESDMSVSTALPCRVSAYVEGDGVTLATLRPTALMGLFGKPELRAVAEEVEAAIVKIMRETA